ncbi:hypothetical protein PF008_g21168 [Phytophthora fragariae]|uniref:Pectate lyase n=1 Tax=Phytophthora fragariae TaxID=53985 RepID=A0A6G0QXD2_9STRA|nr:hypothetical protein PF008_g21168 [Phytophthora fragariae]
MIAGTWIWLMTSMRWSASYICDLGDEHAMDERYENYWCTGRGTTNPVGLTRSISIVEHCCMTTYGSKSIDTGSVFCSPTKSNSGEDRE